LLGEALQADGESEAAKKVLSQAVSVLRTQLGAEHPETIRAEHALSSGSI